MVQHCKTCEVSHNEGTECDCGNWAVVNGGIESGKRASRIKATLPFRALCKFIASGMWDGVSEVSILSLPLLGLTLARPHRWGETYHPDDIWDFVHEFYAPEVCYLSLVQELFNDPEELLIAPLSVNHIRLEASEGMGGMVIL